ncbi:DUF6701 domain-containing protein [Propionivibrio dicarboxylicus]|uniref:MSHA biogenesis protein MshQ n=1 Tax=Propionivibrio dicarboxylicus TaxID=83767 RepID=A0A1G8BXS5_9RHOO|nr:DUF6701 domain-containing protein [Propionivibrio dicarboxylicus]SDH37928.1 hypothetical protein SAMN05660652_01622 [Propionivibrio dicarboxylicus]
MTMIFRISRPMSMGCSARLAQFGIPLLTATLVTLAVGGVGLPASAWATSCLVPITINDVLTPIIAGSGGLSISENDNTVSTNGTSYSKITKGNGGSLDAVNASVQTGTLTLPLFSPSTFPNTGNTNVSLSSGQSLPAGSYDTVTLSNGGNYTFGTGTYYINALKINSNTTTLTLGAGDYFIRHFDSGQGNNDVTIRTNGVTRLFIGSSLAVHDAFDFNSAGATANLQLYLYAGATAFFHDRGIFNGLIYAPNAASCSDNDTSNNCIFFHDNSTITGAILSGSTVFLHNSNDINFSSAVRSAIGGIAIPGCIQYTPDHYELSLPSVGIACEKSPIKVTACASATAPCIFAFTAVNGSSVRVTTTAGTLGATSLTFDANGSASTTLSYPTATDDTTAKVSLMDVTETVKCCQDESTCSTASSCYEILKTSGFIISSTPGGMATTLPAIKAGCAGHETNTNYYLRAVQNGSTDGTCKAALTGQSNVDFGYQCNNPTTCSLTNAMVLNGDAIAGNENGLTAKATTKTLNFDANGNAQITFNYYADAGQVSLFAKTSSLSGKSNPFVVAPDNFALTDLPPAPLVAGDPFNVTVTAQNACNTVTPNFGKETSAATATLTSSNPLPAQGNAAAISTTLSGFNSGGASTNAIWQEVGTVDLTATTTAYLGSVLNVSGTKANVGGFKPAYFDVAPIVPACGTAFTYSGQAIQSVTVTARERQGKTTGNYGGDWAKAVTLSDTSDSTQHLINNTIAAAAIAGGVATLKPTYTFADKLSAPANIGLRAIDTDGVTSSDHTEATTKIRSGRLVLFSALGSNKTDLNMPLQTQYWSGKSWVINSDDSCTALPSGAFALSGGLAANTNVLSAVTFFGGNANITLSAPNDGKAGSVDVAVNLGSSGNDVSCLNNHGGTGAAMPWLRSRNGDCANSYDRDPWARATFGVYAPETRRIIYVHDAF